MSALSLSVRKTTKEDNGLIVKEPKKAILHTKGLNLWYGDNHALKNINLPMLEKEVTAIIGPSGCGKSTYIKTLNRMVELVADVKITGEILYRERNIFDANYLVEELRTRIGMVFQKPNPFPKSIFENVAYGPKNSWDLGQKKFSRRLWKKA